MARPHLKQPNVKLAKRGGKYYAHWWWEGMAHRRSLKTSDEQEARERFQALTMSCSAPQPEWSAATWAKHSNPSHKGTISEAKVLVRLLELGANVFTPWGHDHKSDFIIALGCRTKRVQVKTVRKVDYGVIMRGVSVTTSRGGNVHTILKAEECDLLIGYYPATDDCYVTEVTGVRDYKIQNCERLDSLDAIFLPMRQMTWQDLC